VQNTVTNLGASIGTALAGTVLISALTTSFLTGVAHNPQRPSGRRVQGPGGAGRRHPVPVRPRPASPARQGRRASKEADAIVTENANARIDGLRSSLALLAIIALIALFATRRIPAQQPTASPESEPTALTGEP
jgi:hypothetical protein